MSQLGSGPSRVNLFLAVQDSVYFAHSYPSGRLSTKPIVASSGPAMHRGDVGGDGCLHRQAATLVKEPAHGQDGNERRWRNCPNSPPFITMFIDPLVSFVKVRCGILTLPLDAIGRKEVWEKRPKPMAETFLFQCKRLAGMGEPLLQGVSEPLCRYSEIYAMILNPLRFKRLQKAKALVKAFGGQCDLCGSGVVFHQRPTRFIGR